jgi:hypothetical protein
MKNPSIVCSLRKAVLLGAIIGALPAMHVLGADCFKDVVQTSYCTTGTVPLCSGPEYSGWDCTPPLGEQMVSSAVADGANLPTSKTIERRGCRQYKICTKTGQPVKICWGKKDGEDADFVSGNCPQGG